VKARRKRSEVYLKWSMYIIKSIRVLMKITLSKAKMSINGKLILK